MSTASPSLRSCPGAMLCCRPAQDAGPWRRGRLWLTSWALTGLPSSCLMRASPCWSTGQPLDLTGWRCSIKPNQGWHHGRACLSHRHVTRPKHTAISRTPALSNDTHSQLESPDTIAHLRVATAPLYRRHGATRAGDLPPAVTKSLSISVHMAQS